MVAQYSETFCSPRMITNGTNGVTENVGLRFLLSQAIPRSQLAMLSPFQTQRQSTETVGSKTHQFLLRLSHLSVNNNGQYH